MGGSNPPAAGATGPGPNQPIGMTQVYDNPMSDPITTQPNAYNFFGYAGQISNTLLVSDSSAPASPALIYRLLFPAGAALGGGAPTRWAAGDGFPTNRGQLYSRTRVRFSSNWSFNGNDQMKFWFPRQNDNNLNHVALSFRGVANDPDRLTLEWIMQNPPYFDVGGGGSLRRGEWQDIEVLILPNTPGQSNGGIRMWINGALVESSSNLEWFAAGETPRWDYIWVDPTYSVGSNPVGPQNIWFDIDHWYLSVAP